MNLHEDLHHRLCRENNIIPRSWIIDKLGYIPDDAKRVVFAKGVENIVGPHYRLREFDKDRVVPTPYMESMRDIKEWARAIEKLNEREKYTVYSHSSSSS